MWKHVVSGQVLLQQQYDKKRKRIARADPGSSASDESQGGRKCLKLIVRVDGGKEKKLPRQSNAESNFTP